MFRKMFLASLLALGLNADSLFVGVNAGVPITTPKYSGNIANNKSMLPTTGVGYNLGVNLGYKSEFNAISGIKYYVDYNYSESYGKKSGNSMNMNGTAKANIKSHLITLNADLYYRFTSMFGAYLGIGVGYVSYNPEYTLSIPMAQADQNIAPGEKGGFALPLNLGFSFDITRNHGLSLGTKIPLIGYKYEIPSNNPQYSMMSGNVTLRNYIVYLGYNFSF